MKNLFSCIFSIIKIQKDCQFVGNFVNISEILKKYMILSSGSQSYQQIDKFIHFFYKICRGTFFRVVFYFLICFVNLKNVKYSLFCLWNFYLTFFFSLTIKNMKTSCLKVRGIVKTKLLTLCETFKREIKN